jgi:hypothetical protein
MQLVLHDGGREVRLVSRDQFIEFSSDASALDFLRHLMTDPTNGTALWQALAHERVDRCGGRVGNHEVMAELAQRLVHGEIKVVSGPHIYGERAVHPPPDPEERATTPREDEQAAKAQRPAPEPEEETTWIEIELLDDAGNPIPNEQYSIEIPGGSVRVGRLDGNGRARIEGLDPNTCKVSFPNLDKSSYKRIG